MAHIWTCSCVNMNGYMKYNNFSYLSIDDRLKGNDKWCTYCWVFDNKKAKNN